MPCLRSKVPILLVLSAILSCRNIDLEPDYPAIIKAHHLELLYDRAKWEIYKMNSSNDNKYDSEFVVHFESLEDYEKLRKVQKAYDQTDKKVIDDKNRLNQIFGARNVKKFIECDLVWLDWLEEDLFEGNKINIILFPKFPEFSEGDRYVEKLGSGFYYTVIFENGKIIGMGCDDGFEIEIKQEQLDSMNHDFLKYIDVEGNKVNDWVIAYRRRMEN